MSSFNRNEQQAEQAKKEECLARYLRCKQKLDSCNRPMVRNWLERLSADERQLCRVVLNNLVMVRKQKQEKGRRYV
ncbi:hypothetical protein [Shewanella sp.]|uniref:hypothetical protein n=1 Tax=Shewanella sp. TaxID=50422 RepID=UPI001EB9FF2D|nr:hypothetical protein [Shewanella sp.]NRB24057.1 hypothetical protein [Shewanella sp.]